MSTQTHRLWRISGAAALALAPAACGGVASGDASGVSRVSAAATTYPWHTANATFFYIGSGEDYAGTQNTTSAWDAQWMSHYGGVDDPNNRCWLYDSGPYAPCWSSGLAPNENPFYAALPYNDLQDENRMSHVYWAPPSDPGSGVSIVKNRWLAISYGGATAYAQWEDAGPDTCPAPPATCPAAVAACDYDDFSYVFGADSPCTQDADSGYSAIDISPAVRDYLQFPGTGQVTWAFVDDADVPDGPWKIVITTSGITD